MTGERGRQPPDSSIIQLHPWLVTAYLCDTCGMLTRDAHFFKLTNYPESHILEALYRASDCRQKKYQVAYAPRSPDSVCQAAPLS